MRALIPIVILMFQVIACGESDQSNEIIQAEAGPDQNAVINEVIIIDGSNSRAPYKDSLVYHWEFVSIPAGSVVVLNDKGAKILGFVADLTGDYVLSLTVSDGVSVSEKDTVTIRVGENTCNTNSDCNNNEYCEKTEGSCEVSGYCIEKPSACPAIYQPVCGCNNQSFSNGCDAASSGVNVFEAGLCP